MDDFLPGGCDVDVDFENTQQLAVVVESGSIGLDDRSVLNFATTQVNKDFFPLQLGYRLPTGHDMVKNLIVLVDLADQGCVGGVDDLLVWRVHLDLVHAEWF